VLSINSMRMANARLQTAHMMDREHNKKIRKQVWETFAASPKQPVVLPAAPPPPQHVSRPRKHPQQHTLPTCTTRKADAAFGAHPQDLFGTHEDGQSRKGMYAVVVVVGVGAGPSQHTGHLRGVWD